MDGHVESWDKGNDLKRGTQKPCFITQYIETNIIFI